MSIAISGHHGQKHGSAVPPVTSSRRRAVSTANQTTMTTQSTPNEDRELTRAIRKARRDARKFGYGDQLREHFSQFSPPERLRRAIAMVAEIDVWLQSSTFLVNLNEEVSDYVKQEKSRK